MKRAERTKSQKPKHPTPKNIWLKIDGPTQITHIKKKRNDNVYMLLFCLGLRSVKKLC